LEQYVARIGTKTYRGPQKPKYSDLFDKDKNYLKPTHRFIHLAWTHGSAFAPKIGRLGANVFAPEHPPLPSFPLHRWIQIAKDTRPWENAATTPTTPTFPRPRQDKFRRLTSIEAMEDERNEFDNDDTVSLGDMKAMANKEDQNTMTDIRDEMSKTLPPIRPCLKSKL